jgi:CheY-like chemotaxis protein
MPEESRPIDILLIEDNPADIRLTVEAFKEAKVRNRLHVARDGAAAWALLRSVKDREAPPPDLILLDLNLPKMDGRDVLGEIKNDQDLKHIPVVVLTTSGADVDVLRCYQLRANAFITKPVEVDDFYDIIRSIEHFWLQVVKLSHP